MNIYNRSPVQEPDAVTPPARWAANIAGQIDLRRLWMAFRRRIRLVGAVALAVFLAVVLVTLQATPKYTATANVMLDPRKERVTNVQDVLSPAGRLQRRRH